MFLKKHKKIRLLIMLALGTSIFVPVQAQEAPPKLQAALIMKLLAFYTNLGGDPFTIHVVGAPEIAKELTAMVGKPAGKAKLAEVTQSDGVPSGKASVVYVGKDVAASTGYTQANKVLSVTGNPDFVNQGVTLGIGIEGGKPKVLLNLSSSKNEGINWAPSILKVAATIN